MYNILQSQQIIFTGLTIIYIFYGSTHLRRVQLYFVLDKMLLFCHTVWCAFKHSSFAFPRLLQLFSFWFVMLRTFHYAIVYMQLFIEFNNFNLRYCYLFYSVLDASILLLKRLEVCILDIINKLIMCDLCHNKLAVVHTMKYADHILKFTIIKTKTKNVR